ncbi:uncharacterized protein [Venturia canescens]|uniref:uncharacterized protein n=1 Tax=Venturia canescens TaxID=32260 RepID=UPI001C9D4FB9|nr:uncharacterized protein LOC122406319 [Venturia canescens]
MAVKCTVVEDSSNRTYAFYFQVNQQVPHRIDGIDLSTYVKLKHSMDFSLEFITDLLKKNILLNLEEKIDVLWKSADSIDLIETTSAFSQECELGRMNPSPPQPGSTQLTPASRQPTAKAVKGLQADLKKLLKPDVKRQKGKKSQVWCFFIKTLTGGTCKLCGVAVKASGNTTNLTNHIIRRHHDSGRSQSLLPRSIRTPIIECYSKDQNDDPDNPEELQIVSGNNKPTEISIAGNSRELPVTLKRLQLEDHQLSEAITSVQPRIDNAVSKMSSFRDGGTAALTTTNTLLFMIVNL